MARWKTIAWLSVLALLVGSGSTSAQTREPAAGQGDRGDPLTLPENHQRAEATPTPKTVKAEKKQQGPTNARIHEPAAGQGDRGDPLAPPQETGPKPDITGKLVLGAPTNGQTREPAAGQGDRGDPLSPPENSQNPVRTTGNKRSGETKKQKTK